MLGLIDASRWGVEPAECVRSVEAQGPGMGRVRGEGLRKPRTLRTVRKFMKKPCLVVWSACRAHLCQA